MTIQGHHPIQHCCLHRGEGSFLGKRGGKAQALTLRPPFLPSTGGRPPLRATSSATVFVNLLDLNDNDPTFQNLPFVAEIAEGLPAGSSVFQVSLSLCCHSSHCCGFCKAG